MKTHLVLTRLCVVSFAFGCGDGLHGSSLNHYDQEMMQTLDDVDTAEGSHTKQVLAETDLSKLADLERSHADDMDELMTAMQNAQGSIARCTNERSAGSHMDGWQSMHDANAAMGMDMQDIQAEMQRHAVAMRAARDLATGLDEEHAHQTNMDEILSGMRSHDEHMMDVMHGMEQQGASMMCSMMSHMHGA